MKTLFARSDRGLKKMKTSKDAEPTKGPKAKESQSSSSKGTKSQPKSSGKSVQSEEPEFEVVDSDLPQDQEGNLGNDDDEPMKETLMTLASFVDKPSKTLDELMSTPIDFSAYIMNDLKITNLTQETLLGPAIKLLKGARSNYDELEYDFEECFKALSEKLNWENLKGDDYPFDLTKPLPLVMSGNFESYQKKINVTKQQTTKSSIRKRDPYTPYQDPQGFIYVDNKGRNKLMRLDELYKFSDRTLTGLRTSLDDITKNIRMEYLPKRRSITLEKKRANIMIKAIDKQLKERRLMRSLEKFVGGRHYGTDLRLLQ
ncbi:hypothetical protein Tco_0748477 [Tanacetum coccineum]|uniref:Uncharacterized protein n=1 Tax=Tanacetum coccineum TaxID=301880 RepID=A0ABQ4YWQ3_9ASTR